MLLEGQCVNFYSVTLTLCGGVYQFLFWEQISLGQTEKVGGQWREKVKEGECKGTEDSTSFAAPHLLPLAAPLPPQWLHPAHQSACPHCHSCRSEHWVSGLRDHCFLSQNGTHPGLKDSNPLVTRPPSPFLPRAVTIHTCLEGPVNRVAQLLQPAGPNRDSRQEGQGAVEADEVSLPGGAVQVVACTRVPTFASLESRPSFAKSCASFFLICMEFLPTCQALCLLNSIHQRGCLLQICKNQLCVPG